LRKETRWRGVMIPEKRILVTGGAGFLGHPETEGYVQEELLPWLSVPSTAALILLAPVEEVRPGHQSEELAKTEPGLTRVQLGSPRQRAPTRDQ
jgi:hypothetical protein